MNALFLFRLIVKNINGCGEGPVPTISVLAKYAPLTFTHGPTDVNEASCLNVALLCTYKTQAHVGDK